MLIMVFWISIIALFYSFVGYPIAVWLLARFRGRRAKKAYLTPKVSVVLACLNEEKAIAAIIINLLQCDYPEECLEILIVSDGSSDRTVEIARRYEPQGVRVFQYNQRKGKPAALNLGLEQARGEIIVFADAR